MGATWIEQYGDREVSGDEHSFQNVCVYVYLCVRVYLFVCDRRRRT